MFRTRAQFRNPSNRFGHNHDMRNRPTRGTHYRNPNTRFYVKDDSMSFVRLHIIFGSLISFGVTIVCALCEILDAPHNRPRKSEQNFWQEFELRFFQRPRVYSVIFCIYLFCWYLYILYYRCVTRRPFEVRQPHIHRFRNMNAGLRPALTKGHQMHNYLDFQIKKKLINKK